jgi:tetratricopeptide (TPR) repeat protein
MARQNDYLNLGESFEERGKYFKAERLYKKALKLQQRGVDEMSPELIPYLYNLGMIQAALDKSSDALKTLGRLIDILRKTYGEEYGEVQEISMVMDELLIEHGQLAVNA